MKASLKRLALVLPLIFAGVYALAQWGIGIVVIENVPPSIERIALYDNNGNLLLLWTPTNEIKNVSLELGDTKFYTLEIVIRDNNSANDISEVITYIYSPDCTNKTTFNEQFCYGFKWNKNGFYELSYTGWINTTYILKNYTIVNSGDYKIVNLTIQFPKIARHYDNYIWTIEVLAEDHTTNVSKVLTDYFDFNYYVEFSLSNTTLNFYTTKLGSNTTVVPLNITVIAVNHDSKIYIYSNQTYLTGKYGEVKTDNPYYGFDWPIGYVYISYGANTISLSNVTQVLSTIPAGTKNAVYTLNWYVYVPAEAFPGNYSFYYFIDISK